MKNTMLEYLDWRGDLTFKESPFNEIDNIIFSELVFLDFSYALEKKASLELSEGRQEQVTTVTIKEGIEAFFEKHDMETYKFGLIVPSTVTELSKRVMKSRRFKDVKIALYEKKVLEEKNTQFCGTAFILDTKEIVVAFEGTDDTMVGWKENLNMFFEAHTYAQKESAKFINLVDELIPKGGIYVVGHSKGGNLAYYSAMFAHKHVQNRIIRIINNDGPGFKYDRYKAERATIIDEKGITIIPDSSVIGMIMEQRGQVKIVSSYVHNLFQHDPYELKVMGKEFVKANEMTKESLKIKEKIDHLFNTLPPKDAKEAIDELFDCLEKHEKKTLLDLTKYDFRLLRDLTKLGKKSKKIFMNFINILVSNDAFIK